jgi:inosine/xanthosine triphosphatase
MKRIVIASKNPVKIRTTLLGFKRMFPSEEFEVKGVSVPSGVSHQPMSEDETYKGAFNRVQRAKEMCKDADFWVGIEGGVEEKDNEMRTFAWIVIMSKKEIGKGRTATFFLPKRVVELIKSGKELGEADDIVFGRMNSKQKNGAIGILTGDVIDRVKLYEQAVISALIPFKNKGIY